MNKATHRDAGASRARSNDRLAPRAFGDGCVVATSAKRENDLLTFAPCARREQEDRRTDAEKRERWMDARGGALKFEI